MDELSSNPRYLTPSQDTTYRFQILRSVLQNHIQLSAMADQKANILIGTSLLIFSFLLPQIQQHGLVPYLMVMLLTAVLSGFTAILSIDLRAQKLLQFLSRRSHLHQKPIRFNPFFFATFVHMTENDYIDYMFEHMLRSEVQAYEVLLIDLYRLGVVLEEKYSYISYSYLIFAMGLIVSALLLIISVITQ